MVLWTFGALRYDFPWIPGWIALLYLIGLCVWLFRLKTLPARLAAVGGSFLVVLIWWFTLDPSNDRPWQPDVAQTGWAEIKDDTVILHNVRHCDYRTETDYTPQWTSRTVRLSQITGIDLAVTYWGSSLMAHPIVSFQFADAPPVCFSIETRKEKGESYSAIGGFFRQYELVYIVSEEADVVRLRTNFREGEDVYLYRLNITPDQARARFMEYLTSMNTLRDQPRWYNALTTNCTTSIRTQHNGSERAPWDWRLLANGKGDELLFSRGRLITDGFSFKELKNKAHINDAARAAGNSPDFSRLIRVGRPGFSNLPPAVATPALSGASAPPVEPAAAPPAVNSAPAPPAAAAVNPAPAPPASVGNPAPTPPAQPAKETKNPAPAQRQKPASASPPPPA
jgi:hypothetical protein